LSCIVLYQLVLPSLALSSLVLFCLIYCCSYICLICHIFVRYPRWEKYYADKNMEEVIAILSISLNLIHPCPNPYHNSIPLHLDLAIFLGFRFVLCPCFSILVSCCYMSLFLHSCVLCFMSLFLHSCILFLHSCVLFLHSCVFWLVSWSLFLVS
jgi:hypothetical protein